MPVDMGALVIFVPTVNTVEEAQRAVDWVYFPPMGRRSAGGGQGPSEIWADVPGGFRQTWNDNVVLVMMIETLEGVKNAREIAQIEGVTGLFAAAGDIGNFSGYAEGEDEYEMLITEIVEAAQEAGKIVCGPLRWMGVRPEYNCFQGGHDVGFVTAGARAQLDAAYGRWETMQAASVGPDAEGGSAADGEAQAGIALAAAIRGECGQIVYEEDCFGAIRDALGSTDGMSEEDLEPIRSTLAEVIDNNPAHAERLRELVGEAGFDL